MRMAGHEGVPVVRGVRRAAIVVIITALVVAAGLGIAALLSGEFGELQSRVLTTTLVVAGFGTTALCHLAVVARRVRVVGFTGLAASAAAAVTALVLIWADLDEFLAPAVGRTFGVLTVVAVSLAQVNLLLLLARRRHPGIRVSLGVTLAAVAVVAGMLIPPIATDGAVPGDDGEWYWRWLGVVGILDALGTIALPILGLVLRTRPEAPAATTIELPADVAARLAEEAARRDTTADALAVDLVRRGLAG